MRDGVECFMLFVALIVETERAITGIEIVSEFPEVFPDDVPGLSPMRDVVFSIDLLSEVRFLGYVILTEGIVVDPVKVEAVIQWERPRTITKIMIFVGLTGYYQRFIEFL
ncbi:uncharacterized protein LOC109813075 [Cajanus cajan]|uniref:uncharacterized protein LOC109813075 n=1 Tax=Cajanus cajan TaxID=3821 RepID=UPI00098D932E|nr:uncharacterized protein LOC109813075 [Cajanus cajan]